MYLKIDNIYPAYYISYSDHLVSICIQRMHYCDGGLITLLISPIGELPANNSRNNNPIPRITIQCYLSED